MNRTSSITYILVCTIIGMNSTFAAPLPGGASSLSENYEDWTIGCNSEKDKTVCVMNQTQSSSQTGQRLLTVELSDGDEGKLDGVLILPFGLDLSKGTALKLPAQKDLVIPFSTCLPQGCLVPLTLTNRQVAELGSSQDVTVNAVTINTEQLVSFKVSLKGFKKAVNRIRALTK